MERAGLFLYDPTLRVVRHMGSAGVDPDLLDGVEGTLEETPVAQRALAEDSVVEISEGLERQVTPRSGVRSSCRTCLGRSPVRSFTSTAASTAWVACSCRQVSRRLCPR
jgi:hypothetical protein